GAARLGEVHPPDRLRLVGAAAQGLGQFRHVGWQVVPEDFDRNVVHARGAAVGRYLGVAGAQVALRPHLVDQAVPDASFHALFERGQHALGPDRGFRPSPAARDISVLSSRCRHWRRWAFPWHGPSASISLRPFAPPALPGFLATMDALTPGGAGLGGAWPVGPSWHRQVSLRHVVGPSGRSVSNHLWPPAPWGLLRRRGLPRARGGRPSGTPVPVGRIGIGASPFGGTVPTAHARIDFVLLRTSPSPPVAPRLSSPPA